MIKVERIHIEEFRGIRSLTLDLAEKNFAVSGPNGTGKSGIVDALEFGLTGAISRLAGRGQGALSVKEHGPHVDSRTTPEKAKVRLDVWLSGPQKRASIERTVARPRQVVITPNDPDVRAAIEEIGLHPELALSRRDIIKYVIAEPGARAEEVETLLRLDDVGAVRTVLRRIANATEKTAQSMRNEREARLQALTRALSVTSTAPDVVLQAANARRRVLGLASLERLEATTSLRDGIDSAGQQPISSVPKVQAKADVVAAREAIQALSTPAAVADRDAAQHALEELAADATLLGSVTRESLLQTAIDLFDGEACPVCSTPWERDAFLFEVRSKLDRLAEVRAKRKACEQLVRRVTERLETVRSALRPPLQYAGALPERVERGAVVALGLKLKSSLEALEAFLPIDQSLAALIVEGADIQAADGVLVAVERIIDALPEPSDRDAARDYLLLGDERLREFRAAASASAVANERSNTAKQVFELYERETTGALNNIYREVEEQFRSYYRQINHDDESNFTAKLTPSLGKLGFEVDFYGRGYFPPGAYHSEGHQDGMGLCLYLALMRHLLGANFSFAVLDDVLMSVDAGHRRDVCVLLKQEFPNTQFVLTTHDPVWLRYMKSAGLIDGKNAIEFRKWDVANGPSEWKSGDVEAEIADFLDKNEVRAAAGLLRFHLEHRFAELCSSLGGQVRYRGDQKYELGDLMSGAVGAYRSHLKKAKAAAQSWGQADVLARVTDVETAFDTVMKAAFGEQWQTNLAIHHNEWAQFVSADFRPVAQAFVSLERSFDCQTCHAGVYVVRSGMDDETLRCQCGTISFNLRKKQSS